jgi:hypothetical protein
LNALVRTTSSSKGAGDYLNAVLVLESLVGLVDVTHQEAHLFARSPKVAHNPGAGPAGRASNEKTHVFLLPMGWCD